MLEISIGSRHKCSDVVDTRTMGFDEDYGNE